MQSN
jgi:hypothetical protein